MFITQRSRHRVAATAMNIIRPSATGGHLDPCAQEFTPASPYTLFQGPPPSVFFSYSLDAPRHYIPQPAVIPAPSAVPVYHNPAAPFPTTATMPQPYNPSQPQPQPQPQPQVRVSSSVPPSNKLSPVTSPRRPAGQVLQPREHATRALLLSPVPTELPDSELRRELEAWGPVRAMDLSKKREGFVTVLYYDIRHAKEALADVQEQHLMQQRRLQRHFNDILNERLEGRVPPPAPPGSARGLIGGRAIWAQYAIPQSMPRVADSHNQGTLVVFNLDADMNCSRLKSIFEAFGPVRELRETPTGRLHKFVEFFDVRDAARALENMDGKEIGGKTVKIEFSRPVGTQRRPLNPPPRTLHQQPPPPPPPPPQPPVLPPLPRNFMHNHVPLPRPPPPRWRESTWQTSECDKSARSTPRGRGCGRFVNPPRQEPPRRRPPAPGYFCQPQRHSPSFADNAGFPRVRYFPRVSPSGDDNGNGSSRKESTQFVFEEDFDSSDSRTTVMIKNIPNKYSQQMLLSMLDQHCISSNERLAETNEPLSAFDFVYLPIDFKNRCNLGYAFVNMTTPKATWKMYKAFHKQPWEAFNSRKICEVTYARIQGRDALVEHFSNSKFACDTEEYLPLVFSPPRDGKQPFKYQAMGTAKTSTPTTTTAAAKSSSRGGSRVDDKEKISDPKRPPPVNDEEDITTQMSGLKTNSGEDKTCSVTTNASNTRTSNWTPSSCTQSNPNWSERRRPSLY